MNLDKVTKYLLITSAIFLVLGLFWHFFGRNIPWGKIPLGRLPGDIYIKKENSSFYFPITTSILVSIILSIIFNILRK